MGEQSEQEKKSGSDKLKMVDRIPLQKPAVAESERAATGKGSMQVAEKLKSQQTQCVIYCSRALPRSLIHVLFCRLQTYYPIE